MVNNFAELEQKLKNSTTKSVLALCCSQDKHSLEAVAKARRGGLIEAVLIGDVAKTKENLRPTISLWNRTERKMSLLPLHLWLTKELLTSL